MLTVTQNDLLTNRAAERRRINMTLGGNGGGGDVPIDKNICPSDDGNMEARVTALEKAAEDTRNGLIRMEVRLDSFATKSDISVLEAILHKELHGLTWRLIGVAGALVAAVYFVAKHA